MKKLLLCSIILISLSACFQKNEKNNEGNTASESKVVSVDSKLIVENYEKLILKFKRNGESSSPNEEDSLDIISTNLIFIQEIDTNRNQPYAERGAYQCNLSTKLIRLSDGKELLYSDIFSVKEDEVVKAISKYLNDNKKDLDESDLKLINKSLASFYFFDRYTFSLRDPELYVNSCDIKLFDKDIPIDIISPYFTEWMKQQLKITK